MALSALLFSKNPETAQTIAAVLAESGMRAEICVDIFSAIEKGTKQAFPCVIVDWPDQPEASFLLKRARESGANRNTVAIAIVDDEPPPDQQRDHRLEFLIYRPITVDEVRAVLAKARQKMQLQSAVFSEDLRASHPDQEAPQPPDPDDPNLVSIAADLPKNRTSNSMADASDPEASEDAFEESEPDVIEPGQKHHINFRAVAATLLLLAVPVCFWRSAGAFQYLAQTPEGAFHVLKESTASLFYLNRPGGASLGAAMTDAQQDAYFSRTASGDTKAQSSKIGLLTSEIALPDGLSPLPKAFDFPLPTPELLPKEQAPAHVERRIPDSLRNSAPIAPPVVVTVNPAQMMAVSVPVTPHIQQVSEPVAVSEESARALAITTVDPAYPAEAKAQKLQGTVVLQALIGRDGSVEDLKLIRGYFVLSRAAIAAVKQWRFRPYVVNGRPLETQTTITVNFTYPTT
jgi:TonB family protein